MTQHNPYNQQRKPLHTQEHFDQQPHNEIPKDTVEEIEVELYTDLKGYNFGDAEIHLILEKVREHRTTAYKKGHEAGFHLGWKDGDKGTEQWRAKN